MSTKNLPGLDFPVRNIFCIGRNYADHAKELNNPLPTEPVVFLKPTSALCFSGEKIILPQNSKQLHHEVEIVVAIGAQAKQVSQEKALEVIAGYAVGIDVTARDVQEQLKQKALPWALAKGFDTSAPVSRFVLPTKVADPQALSLSLQINGVEKQKGSSADMIFSIATLISFLSMHFTLDRGDLIFTGTPKGVGPMVSGDQVRAVLGDGLSVLELAVK